MDNDLYYKNDFATKNKELALLNELLLYSTSYVEDKKSDKDDINKVFSACVRAKNVIKDISSSDKNAKKIKTEMLANFSKILDIFSGEDKIENNDYEKTLTIISAQRKMLKQLNEVLSVES
jgi:hypothetical protein